MAKPSLLIISFSKIVSDARVLKQISLFSSDWEVTTCGYGPKPEGTAAHICIPDEHVYWQRSRLWTMMRAYRKAYWSSPAVSWSAQALAGQKFDAILADDIDSVGLALSLKPRWGVHADLHEYSPREKEDVPRWRLFVAPYMRWQVRHFVTSAASSSTVGQHIAKEYHKVFGIEPIVVTNATPHVDLTPTEVGNPIALVHSGAARDDRFLDVMIEAAARFPGRFTFDLYLTPNDPGYLERLREQTQNMEGITVHDGVPYRELLGTLNRYDVGVHLLPPVNFNNKWALPNKFFDFLQARLCMVIGPSPEMAALAKEHDLGLVADGFTADDLAAQLDKLTPEKVAHHKEAAHRAAHVLSAETTIQGWKRCLDKLRNAHDLGR